MAVRATRPKKSPAGQNVRQGVQPKADRPAHSDLPSMEEPSLREMLRDPIMQRLMTSDGITHSQLLSLFAAARSRLRDDRYAD